jgi:uncharacterized protein YhbP (UPF0306 family)
MTNARGILEDYVSNGKLMQVASISEEGGPWLCHVWYRAQFSPDRLYFISRLDREHSINIRRDERVAGGIISIPLIGLGQTVTGVTFQGFASELDASADNELRLFLTRWPRARASITTERIEADRTSSRLYEIRVNKWILFDEHDFPDEPRQLISGI